MLACTCAGMKPGRSIMWSSLATRLACCSGCEQVEAARGGKLLRGFSPVMGPRATRTSIAL
eukprot:1974566-Pyramimonas_sp.AAC.1